MADYLTHMTMATDVLATYDDLAAMVRTWRSLDTTNLGDGEEAAPLVVPEARLLDDRRFDEWLAGWTDDGALWVPLDPMAHPASDQSFYLDDVRRLRERVAWTLSSVAWSQQPAVSTVRQVTNVESYRTADGLHVRSVLVLHEHRAAVSRSWAGHQLHLFAPGERLRAKVLLMPALRSAIPHPGVLL